MAKKKDERIREAQGQKSKQTARMNQIRVLQAVTGTPLTFSELLRVTGFSKPVLTKHLKTWMKENAIYKDTIKPDETTNPMDVGKIVYRSYPKIIIPDIVAAMERTLEMPKPNWSEESKAELNRHFEEVARIILKEWEKLRMIERAKLKK